MRHRLALLSLLFILQTLPVLADPPGTSAVPLSKNDKIRIYIIDTKGTDLIRGTFGQENVIRSADQDPHDFLVSLEGKIYVPYVGAISVDGLTSVQVEKIIWERLSPKRPLQDVSVLCMTPKYNVIYINGEVSQPGMYKLDLTKPDENRLLSVISSAGGFTPRADKENIAIIHNNGGVVTVNLTTMVTDLNVGQNLPLHDKDTVIVPQSLGKVYVLGEITTPGGYPFITGATMLDYLSEAGGLKTSAAFDNIGIVRKSGDRYTVYKNSVNGDMTMHLPAKFTLQTGDIIYAAKSFFADWKDIAVFLGAARDYTTVYDWVVR